MRASLQSRNNEIVSSHLRGERVDDIALRYDISRQRVQQICKAVRDQHRPVDPNFRPTVEPVLDGAELYRVRESLGLSQARLGSLLLGDHASEDGREIRKWENGDKRIPYEVGLSVAYMVRDAGLTEGSKFAPAMPLPALTPEKLAELIHGAMISAWRVAIRQRIHTVPMLKASANGATEHLAQAPKPPQPAPEPEPAQEPEPDLETDEDEPELEIEPEPVLVPPAPPVDDRPTAASAIAAAPVKRPRGRPRKIPGAIPEARGRKQDGLLRKGKGKPVHAAAH